MPQPPNATTCTFPDHRNEDTGLCEAIASYLGGSYVVWRLAFALLVATAFFLLVARLVLLQDGPRRAPPLDRALLYISTLVCFSFFPVLYDPLGIESRASNILNILLADAAAAAVFTQLVLLYNLATATAAHGHVTPLTRVIKLSTHTVIAAVWIFAVLTSVLKVTTDRWLFLLVQVRARPWLPARARSRRADPPPAPQAIGWSLLLVGGLLLFNLSACAMLRRARGMLRRMQQNIYRPGLQYTVLDRIAHLRVQLMSVNAIGVILTVLVVSIVVHALADPYDHDDNDVTPTARVLYTGVALLRISQLLACYLILFLVPVTPTKGARLRLAQPDAGGRS